MPLTSMISINITLDFKLLLEKYCEFYSSDLLLNPAIKIAHSSTPCKYSKKQKEVQNEFQHIVMNIPNFKMNIGSKVSKVN